MEIVEVKCKNCGKKIYVNIMNLANVMKTIFRKLYIG